nr:MAG TPA: hypothetical protein [Caudoviricetes sp.]
MICPYISWNINYFTVCDVNMRDNTHHKILLNRVYISYIKIYILYICTYLYIYGVYQ